MNFPTTDKQGSVVQNVMLFIVEAPRLRRVYTNVIDLDSS